MWPRHTHTHKTKIKIKGASGTHHSHLFLFPRFRFALFAVAIAWEATVSDRKARAPRVTHAAHCCCAPKKNQKEPKKNRRPANLGAILERPRKLGKTEMRKQSGLSVRANIKLKVGVPKLWARRWRREKHKRKLGKSNKKNSVKNVVGRRHAARKTDVVCVGNERKLGTKEQHKLVSP